jgi:hypothetical protein
MDINQVFSATTEKASLFTKSGYLVGQNLVKVNNQTLQLAGDHPRSRVLAEQPIAAAVEDVAEKADRWKKDKS